MYPNLLQKHRHEWHDLLAQNLQRLFALSPSIRTKSRTKALHSKPPYSLHHLSQASMVRERGGGVWGRGEREREREREGNVLKKNKKKQTHLFQQNDAKLLPLNDWV